MARVRSRKSAGSKVGALLDTLSLSLLMEEELCRQHMEALFVGGVPAAAETLTQVIGKGARSVQAAADDVAAAAGRVLVSTEGPFRALADLAVGRGLESIREELTHCEDTLGPKYHGLASDACDAADNAQEALVTLAMMQYRANAGTALTWLGQQLALETRLSLHLQEPPEVLIARLVSPESVRVEQHTGRGLWWKVLEHATRITREIEFATVNTARTEAMTQFNRLGEARSNA